MAVTGTGEMSIFSNRLTEKLKELKTLESGPHEYLIEKTSVLKAENDKIRKKQVVLETRNESLQKKVLR